MDIRVGFGYDVHKLVENRDLWLGGIKIDYELGLLGHSDADVLIHAICDALLGAASTLSTGTPPNILSVSRVQEWRSTLHLGFARWSTI